MDLERFVRAQDRCWPTVLAELRQGRKASHWMWFVFPQIAGLGRSETSRYYALSGTDEARAYLAHPVLGPRMLDALDAAAGSPTQDAEALFGPIDCQKLQASLTLFREAADDPAPFQAGLERFFDGAPHRATLQLLAG